MSEFGQLTLSVHPTVVFKLGDDLITDDLQALTELLKNSYDAGSTRADVTIDTRVWTDLKGQEVAASEAEGVAAQRHRLEELSLGLRMIPDGESADANQEAAQHESAADLRAAEESLATIARELRALPVYLLGRLTVTDAGDGMSRDDIERGWLTVSASPKRELKERLRRDPEAADRSSRTPLGDKGLGRLGVQRLGRVVDLVTRKDGHPPLSCTIDWERFQNAHALRDIGIDVDRAAESTRRGTTVAVRGLASLTVWSDVGHLQTQLAELISPYSTTRGFRVRVRIDGETIDLQEVSRRVLDQSAVRYELEYSDGVLHVEGSMRAEFLRPDRDHEKQAIWERLIRTDNGFSFLSKALGRNSILKRLGVEHGDDERFCHFRTRVALDSVEAEYETDDTGRRRMADPGPFTARIDVIQRRAAASSFDSRDDYSEWVKRSTGVRIYRDGFGVRTKSDWLKFERWMTGSSYYAIRPSNVIGYVDISARENHQLEETTSREEFRDVPAYRNFVALFGNWLLLTEDLQTQIGREYTKYAKEMTPTPVGITPSSTSADIASDIKRALNDVARASKSVERGESSRESATRAATALVRQAEAMEGEMFSDPVLVEQVRRLAADVTAAINELTEAVEPVHLAAAEVRERRNSVDLLLQRLEENQEQLADGWELMSLGITAETVAHEILNLTSRLTASSRQIAKYNDRELRDTRIGTYVEHVRSTTQSLQKQTSRLDASLRYVRDRRTVVDVAELSRRLSSNFTSTLGVTVETVVVEHTPITVRTSEGKLSQAIDNLLHNAIYWVGIARLHDPGHSGRIALHVDSPFLTVEDNGPGVDQNVEAILWEPFITRKPREVGRGLGLFVTRQLLEAEGITATLDHERNSRGNRFRFRLDFSGLLEDA